MERSKFVQFASFHLILIQDMNRQPSTIFKAEIVSISSKVPRCRAQSVTLPICYMVDVWLEFHHRIKSKWVKCSAAMLAAKSYACVTLNLSNP